MFARSRVCTTFWKTKVDPNAPMKFACIPQKRPYIVPVKAGKKYYWCSCGLSKTQPFCDNSHRAFNEKHNTKMVPVEYKAEASKRVMFCGCKQTGNRPLCDFSHVGVLFRTAVGIDHDPKPE